MVGHEFGGFVFWEADLSNIGPAPNTTGIPNYCGCSMIRVHVVAEVSRLLADARITTKPAPAALRANHIVFSGLGGLWEVRFRDRPLI